MKPFESIKGLEIAIKLGWYDFTNFDHLEYEYYERVQNGDMNWIIPGKFMAFMGPSGRHRGPGDHFKTTPEDYIKPFEKFGVKHVVRLNKPAYDKERFERHGIDLTDMFFVDGSTPPMDIVYDFLELSKQEEGGLAVHCKAGLGRTGSLIGIYAMETYDFPAEFFIGWIRIARPGSILGPQQ